MKKAKLGILFSFVSVSGMLFIRQVINIPFIIPVSYLCGGALYYIICEGSLAQDNQNCSKVVNVRPKNVHVTKCYKIYTDKATFLIFPYTS